MFQEREDLAACWLCHDLCRPRIALLTRCSAGMSASIDAPLPLFVLSQQRVKANTSNKRSAC